MSEEVPTGDDERLDELFDGRLRVIQKKKGYRFSIDAVLLAHFSSHLLAHSIIDLGTGSGVIPLILARKGTVSTIVGVEVQEELADMAKRTIALNGFAERVSILHVDLKELRRCFDASSFDLVISNPPYYPVGDGRVNPNEQKAIARHEILATLEDVVRIAHYLVKPSGVVVIIFPAKRLVDLLESLRECDFKPELLQIVYSHAHEEGKLVMVKSRKGGNPELEIKEPFYIYQADGIYSEEMKKIYGEI